MDNLLHKITDVLECDFLSVENNLQEGWIVTNVRTSYTYSGDKTYTETVYSMGKIG